MSSSKPTPRAEPDELESQLLKSLLAARDIACPVCGYNLRAIVSANCPECAATLDLRVGSADLKLGPWLVALLSLALPLGFFGTLAAMTLVSRELKFAGFLTVVVAAYTFVIARLIRKRKSFWRKPRSRQVSAAILYTMLSIVAGAFLVFVIPWLVVFVL